MHRRQQSYWNLGGSVLLCFFLACSFIMRFAVPDSLPTAGSRLRLVLDNLSLSLGNGTVALTALFLAALLLSRFTGAGDALVLGVDVGGLGTPIASLASLIALKLYARSEGARTGRFLLEFTAVNALLLVLLSAFCLLALL